MMHAAHRALVGRWPPQILLKLDVQGSGPEHASLSVLPGDCPAVMVLPIMSDEPPACLI